MEDGSETVAQSRWTVATTKPLFQTILDGNLRFSDLERLGIMARANPNHRPPALNNRLCSSPLPKTPLDTKFVPLFELDKKTDGSDLCRL